MIQHQKNTVAALGIIVFQLKNACEAFIKSDGEIRKLSWILGYFNFLKQGTSNFYVCDKKVTGPQYKQGRIMLI